jgi:hypothetical protein
MKKILRNHCNPIVSARSGILGFLLAAFCMTGLAQTLDFQNKVTITLDDGTTVTLFGARSMSEEFSRDYYYLPANLRLSKKKDDNKTPEFLFLKYTTDERGSVQGALLHFLMEWGLTPQQEEELQNKLTAKIRGMAPISPKFRRVSSPRVMGAATMLTDTEESFRIISATLSSSQFTPEVVTTGRASLHPGSKMAIASNLNEKGAQLLATTFEADRSLADVSLNLRFRYEVMMPRVEGKITVDWLRIDSLFHEIERDYQKHQKHDLNRGFLFFWIISPNDSIIEIEKESLISFLREEKIVNIDLDVQEVDNPIALEVVKVFMDYFMSSFTDKNFVKDEVPVPIENEGYDPGRNVYRYHINRTKLERRIAMKKEEYNLTMRIAIPMEVTLTENLASWYDGVKDNKKCVAAVNLNDPFFQHVDINFFLDGEAGGMFEKEVNYVTVNVRKRRSDGNDFKGHVTFDRTYLDNYGTRHTFTFARDTGNKPKDEEYEYQSQWSFRGGYLYPENPQWVKGNMPSVSLVPPIKDREIIFEADLYEMNELGITRATLQLRYMKFGKEVETNIPLTVSRGQPLVEQIIYTDRNQQGYAYRLVLHQKDKGKMALDWNAKINDDYIYASIPEQLKSQDPDYLNKVLKAAEVIIPPANNGEVKKGHEVLDKFRDVLRVIK